MDLKDLSKEQLQEIREKVDTAKDLIRKAVNTMADAGLPEARIDAIVKLQSGWLSLFYAKMEILKAMQTK